MFIIGTVTLGVEQSVPNGLKKIKCACYCFMLATEFVTFVNFMLHMTHIITKSILLIWSDRQCNFEYGFVDVYSFSGWIGYGFMNEI